jgi:hypothetical protein
MKLKTILLLGESSGFGIAGGPLGGSLTSHDTKLRAYPNSMDDVEGWNGIVEGDGWFVHRESNNWDTKLSGASVYITEGEPHKYWMRIKTHGLRKPNDTNESYRQRINKHSDKVARAWMTAAKKLHNNPEINEVGNEIQMTWKEAFKLALESAKVKPFIAEYGERQINPTKRALDRVSPPISDPINFTPRLEEQANPQIGWSAVVLDEQSKNRLLTEFGSKIPDGFEKIAHHMTITMGGLPPEKKGDVGKTVTLLATHIGISEKAIAVKVSGYFTTNKNPHVTLAIDRNGGANPVDSNKITNWETLPQPISLSGKVTEYSR